MKTAKLILFFTVFFVTNYANADLYKCMKGGHPVYQGTPCEQNSEKGRLGIKEETPEEKAMALEKLQEIRSQYDELQASKQKEAKSAADQAIRQTIVPQYAPAITQQQ